MLKKHVKIAITGAAGNIGYAVAFRIASGQMFGQDTSVDLHLLELERSMPTLMGMCMELEDCAFGLLNRVIASCDLKEVMTGVNWAILIGAVPRQAGMERADLLKVNGGIFASQGKAINDHSDGARVFVVGNPCNTNSLIASRHAPDIPREHFYAMTMLDENRARSQLAKKAGVAVSAVNYMNIWGNHSSTQYPDFYHAKIGNKPATEVIGDEKWLQTEFVPTIQQRGAAVIKARGASSAASAANAIIASIYHLTHDTPSGDAFSVAKCSQGEYGITPGLMFSFPCQVKQGELQVVTGIKHNAYSQEKLKYSEHELKTEYETVKAMGLI